MIKLGKYIIDYNDSQYLHGLNKNIHYIINYKHSKMY